VPATVDDDAAVFVEPVAAACRILEQIELDYTVRVAILGDGRMGQLVAQVLKTKTPEITLFGRHPHKIKVARALGLDARLTGDGAGAASGFDLVVDVTGRGSGLQRALDLVRPRGTVILKTTSHGSAPFESWPAVVNEVSLIGSRCGPFKPALAMLASGAVRVRPLISNVRALADYAAAFGEAPRALKIILNPTSG
jgi:threonine dehydrogenase-like Zn-dependent dehydrogenase